MVAELARVRFFVEALKSGDSSLVFWVGRSLRCQAVVSQPHGIHRLATVATPGRANHSESQNLSWMKHPAGRHMECAYYFELRSLVCGRSFSYPAKRPLSQLYFR